MILGVFIKQPAEKLDYDFDYSEWLDSSDDIASVDVSADTGITVESNSIVGQRVKAYLSGGTHGSTYKVECTVTTDAGRIKQDEIKIKVKDF